MPLIFILLGLCVIALGVLAFVFGAHWREIRLLDPSTLREEQERHRRESLIKQRFETWGASQGAVLRRGSQKAYRGLSSIARALNQRAQVWERSVRAEQRSQKDAQPERLAELLSEAKSFARDLKWADAERQYLEILSIDAHHTDAYKGLASMYLKQKQYDQARETLEYLTKTHKEDDVVFAGLADVEEAEGREAKAEQYRKKALEMNPHQPARALELAQFYLDRGRPLKALPLAQKACELDAKSAKFHELALRAALEARKPSEARALYDRLRLLSDDQGRFQAWRDKVEQLEEEMAHEI